MSLIPPFYLDCVVAIGKPIEGGRRQWVASGFIYGHLIKKTEDGKNRYLLFLVTNRHVFERIPVAFIRLNTTEGKQAFEADLNTLDSNGSPIWLAHPDPNIDIAIIRISPKYLDDHKIKYAFFNSDKFVANTAKLKEMGITEGDFAYILGFPMGIVGGPQNAVIVRGGTIARIRDTISGVNNEFLVDAFIFPGNSGGPVISKPEVLAIEGTKSQISAELIGIVRGYITYRDVAVSQQTGQPRIVFEENSGLSSVHPIDFIDEVITEHIRLNPLPAEFQPVVIASTELMGDRHENSDG